MTSVTVTPGPGRAILERALQEIAGKAAKVGWFSSSVYPNGTPVAYVAAIHEFGYAPKNIPPRMGLRALTTEKRNEWAKVAEYGAKQVFKGGMTGTDMLELIGARAEGDIRKQISSVTEPPLQPATIEARRRRSASGQARTSTGSKPLVDTGYMLASVTHIVSDNTDN